MKKIFLSIAVIFASIFISVNLNNNIYAQQEEDFDFARAYQDYVFTQDTYESASSSYRLARSQYLQAQTLVSQSKARDATVKMLQARDDVLVTYLITIRMKLLETAGVPKVIADGFTQRIDAEINWFRDHKSRITSAGTLEDLVGDSDEAYQHYGIVTEPLVYEVLTTVASGKVDTLRGELSQLLSDTRQKTFEIEANGDFNIGVIQRWLTEIEQKITRSLDKSIEAETVIQELNDTDFDELKDRLEIYNDAIGTLQESYQLLREGSNFMKEIIKELTE